MKHILWITILLTSVSTSFAQTRIDGPDEVSAGRLCVLKLTDLTPSDKAEWVIIAKSDAVLDPARGADWEVFENGTVCVFATPNPGKYLVIVAYSSSSAQIGLIAHPLTVTGSVPVPPNPPPPVPPNPPQPESTWADLAHERAQALVASPRAGEAAKLAEGLRKAASEVTAETDFRKAREHVRECTREAIGSNYIRWLEWSKAIGDAIAEKADTIKTLEDYKKVLMELATGLERVTDG